MNLYKIFFLVLFTTTSATAQVYMCKTEDGPVFSDHKCGKNATEIILQETSGLGVAVPVSVQLDLARKKLLREQSRYRDALYARRDADVAIIDGQITELVRQKSLLNNNLAGATYAAGIDQQIAALRTSRSETRSSYRQLVSRAEARSFPP